MALRIGKAKPTTTLPTDTPPASASAPTDPTNDFNDFSNIPADTDEWPASAAGSTGPASTKKPVKLPPLPLLGGLGLLLLIGIGFGAKTLLFPAAPVDEPAPPVRVRPHKPGGTAPGAAPVTNAAEPGNIARPSLPGASPAHPSGPGKPGAKPMAPPVVALVAPTPAALTTPVHEPMPGAQPGVPDPPNQIRMVPPLSTPAGIQLRQLWNAGRDAKHKGDIAGARKAWQQGLKLAQGNPALAKSAAGFTSSLALLPR